MEKKNLIVIQCPECGINVSFKPVPNYREKRVACPRCHYAAKAGDFRLVLDPANAESKDANPAKHQTQDNEETKIRTDKDKTAIVERPKVILSCVDTNESYELKDGKNTLGRSTSTPKAELLFTDKKGYLSRLHASITVIRDGENVLLHLLDEGSVNGTYLGNTKLKDKTIAKLEPGKTFKMGDLTFRCMLQKPANTPNMAPSQQEKDSDETTL